MYVLNDPFDGGTHLPDLVVTCRSSSRARRSRSLTAITHHQEMGGRSPGSTPMDATEIFQEGVRIPPLKIFDRGVENETFFAMLERNVRIPEPSSATSRPTRGGHGGRPRRASPRRRGYGSDALRGYMDELLDRAEQMTRDAIEAIPDGSYHFVDYLDHDGMDLDAASGSRLPSPSTARSSSST